MVFVDDNNLINKCGTKTNNYLLSKMALKFVYINM